MKTAATSPSTTRSWRMRPAPPGGGVSGSRGGEASAVSLVRVIATARLPAASAGETAGDDGGGPGPGGRVGGQHGVDLVDLVVPPALQRLGDDLGDGGPAQPTAEEGLHRDLVGRAQPGRRRAALAPRRVGQVD